MKNLIRTVSWIIIIISTPLLLGCMYINFDRLGTYAHYGMDSFAEKVQKQSHFLDPPLLFFYIAILSIILSASVVLLILVPLA